MSILNASLPGRLEERQAAVQERLAPIRGLYPFLSHFHDHDGLLQHFVDEGPRREEQLLCLHGNPTWSFYWRRLIGALSSEYRVIAPDHIGCGMSDKPRDGVYTLTAHVERLVALVDALELRDLTLLLHDWGGAIGMGLARRRPELVRRLVVTNTAAFRASYIPRRIAICRRPVFGALAVRGLNAFARAATYMAVEHPLDPEVKRGYLLPYDSWDARIATHAFVRDIPLEPEHPSYAELAATEVSLASFRDRPMQLLWGERDWCFTPKFRERWQSYFPDAEVISFEHAGHYLMEDAGDEVIANVRRFLAEHPLGVPGAVGEPADTAETGTAT